MVCARTACCKGRRHEKAHRHPSFDATNSARPTPAVAGLVANKRLYAGACVGDALLPALRCASPASVPQMTAVLTTTINHTFSIPT